MSQYDFVVLDAEKAQHLKADLTPSELEKITNYFASGEDDLSDPQDPELADPINVIKPDTQLTLELRLKDGNLTGLSALVDSKAVEAANLSTQNKTVLYEIKVSGYEQPVTNLIISRDGESYRKLIFGEIKNYALVERNDELSLVEIAADSIAVSSL